MDEKSKERYYCVELMWQLLDRCHKGSMHCKYGGQKSGFKLIYKSSLGLEYILFKLNLGLNSGFILSEYGCDLT